MSAVTLMGVMDGHAVALSYAIDEAVDTISDCAPLLTASTLSCLMAQREPQVLRDRLFAVAVLGSTRGIPGTALPVSVLSALTWASAAASARFDEVTSNGHPTAPVRTTTESVSNLALLSMRYLDSLRVPQRLKWQWSQDVVRSSLAATEELLTKNRRHSWEVTRTDAIATCLGRSGNAYGRDALMAARVQASEAAEDWRKFGLQYGLLHQLRDNSAGVPPEEDSDLAGGVPTLLLAHAFTQATPARRVELVHLRLAAMHDLSARAVLRELLNAERVVDSYRSDIIGLHRQACQRLGALCGDNEFRAVLRAELDISVQRAVPKSREMIGL